MYTYAGAYMGHAFTHKLTPNNITTLIITVDLVLATHIILPDKSVCLQINDPHISLLRANHNVIFISLYTSADNSCLPESNLCRYTVENCRG